MAALARALSQQSTRWRHPHAIIKVGFWRHVVFFHLELFGYSVVIKIKMAATLGRRTACSLSELTDPTGRDR